MLKIFSYYMRLIGVGVISVVLLSYPPAISKAAKRKNAAPQISLKTFDEDVAESRRQMRKYCAIAQKLMKAETLDPEKKKQLSNILKKRRLCGTRFVKNIRIIRRLNTGTTRSLKFVWRIFLWRWMIC